MGAQKLAGEINMTNIKKQWNKSHKAYSVLGVAWLVWRAQVVGLHSSCFLSRGLDATML